MFANNEIVMRLSSLREDIYPPAGKVDAPPAKAPSKFDVKPLSDRHSAQGGRLRNFLKSDRNVENHSAFGHRREGGPC